MNRKCQRAGNKSTSMRILAPVFIFVKLEQEIKELLKNLFERNSLHLA